MLCVTSCSISVRVYCVCLFIVRVYSVSVCLVLPCETTHREHRTLHSQFSIQHEDFPTLGGQVSCKDFPTLPGQTASGGGVGGTGMGMGGPGGYDSYQQQQQQFQFQQQQAQQAQSQFANSHMGLPGKSGGPVEPGSGSDGPSIAAGSGGGGLATAEEYGLLGLLKIIRMTDVDLNTLALGQDLTTLGLNLNSQEANLYATFGSPWADPPLTREPDYILPACYYTQVRPSQPTKTAAACPVGPSPISAC